MLIGRRREGREERGRGRERGACVSGKLSLLPKIRSGKLTNRVISRVRGGVSESVWPTAAARALAFAEREVTRKIVVKGSNDRERVGEVVKPMFR